MSFFYEGRLPMYAWGGYYNDSAPMFSKDDYIAISELQNQGTNSTVSIYPQVPLAELGARIAVRKQWPIGQSQNNATTVTEEDVPCDKQFPWRKLQADLVRSYVVGLTHNGELYMCLGNASAGITLEDLLCGQFYSEADVLSYPSGLYSLKSSGSARLYIPFRGPLNGSNYNDSGQAARFRRLMFQGVGEAIKDFAVSSSGNIATGASGDAMTLVTKSGRVFVAGSTKNGSHGVPPATTRPDASFIAADASTPITDGFYVPKSPSPLPVVTEVTLPGNVKAAAVPSGSTNCVIGEDGQLYYWWWDRGAGAMNAPKKHTGFVKRATVSNPGSGYALVRGPGVPDATTFTLALEFPTPPGGRAAKGVCQIIDGQAAYVCIQEPGSGYGSPPSPVIKASGGDINGSGAAFETEIFGPDDSFSTTLAAGRGFLLGSDGALYLFALSENISQFGETPQQFKAPVFWHSAGPYTFARNNCVVDSGGTLYVMYGAVRGVDGSVSSVPLNDICVDVDPDGEVQSPNFKRLFFINPIVYESKVLYPVGSGYLCAEAPALSLGAFQGSASVVAIKEDGTLATGGRNDSGVFGDGSPLSASRRTMQEVASSAKWVDVCAFGHINKVACYAIRKDAVCRELDQPMEYYDDEYYKTLQ